MKILLPLVAVLFCVAPVALPAKGVVNPDLITVYFPRLVGEGNLGRNVATVLSLQLAQTGRQKPWPNNPDGDDFNRVLTASSAESLQEQSHEGAEAEARHRALLAQIVVWGEARPYAGAVIADINVTLPVYARPGSPCNAHIPCDYRDENFETWTIRRANHNLSVGPPRRRFAISAVQLSPTIVSEFRQIEGLPIRSELAGGDIRGYTDSNVRFLEFNPKLPGAPTKVSSKNVTGYVTLPELTNGASEYTDMLGGLLQVYRGDWDAATASFGRVLENPATRTPLRLDALLLLGMAQFRDGYDGSGAFHSALKIAPYDRRAVQYAVMGNLASSEDGATARTLLNEKAMLFPPDDPWLDKARRMLKP